MYGGFNDAKARFFIHTLILTIRQNGTLYEDGRNLHQKLARLKYDLFGEIMEGFESSEGSDASDYEEAVVEEKPTIEFTDALIERLRAKKNFGIYQIDMVKTFRIIREVDADHSG